MKRTYSSALLLVAICCVSNARAQRLDWLRQFGTSDLDRGYRVSTDGLGGVYVSGTTYGSLGGTGAGNGDAFLSRYSAHGSLLWTRQLGGVHDDQGYGVSADGLGNVYICGNTNDLVHDAGLGGPDAFVGKYDAQGNLEWTRQFGSDDMEYCYGVSADALGNVYVSGYTSGDLQGANAGWADAFVGRYDADGNLAWLRQLGTSGVDVSTGVVADGLGNVYIAGRTGGSLGAPNAGHEDAFLIKYDQDGSRMWSRQIGTTAYEGSEWVSVAVDGLGNVYIAGGTNGSLAATNRGGVDVFLSKFDQTGDLHWIRQFGTAAVDSAFGVSCDELGDVYIAGYTQGSLEQANAGGTDVFVTKYEGDGSLQWTRQLGTGSVDLARGVAADRSGHVYISGWTSGDLGGANAGGQDAFVAKLTVVPEPSALLLAALAGVGLLARMRH